MTELIEPIVKPVTTLTTKITTGSATLLAIIAIVMSSGLLGQENVYVCEDIQVAMQCDKLSGVNADGFQTRCYYTDESENTRYKNCKTGWLPYVPEKEIVKQDISTKDRVYLLCDIENKFVSQCQIVDRNDTVIRIGA